MSFENAPTYNHSAEADKILGYAGAMISGSKTAPEGETIYWNACIFNEAEEQIWHGDLNITKRADDLRYLANLVGKIFVTPEQPFRFEGLRRGMARDDLNRTLTFEAAA